ncbi:hypothetical protein LZ32DRAFT_65979 [Colletotrichum eremochloae]|nr:hypothetical protein LZ32DRAFT_65979 [Colletotrichum eremochloae]
MQAKARTQTVVEAIAVTPLLVDGADGADGAVERPISNANCANMSPGGPQGLCRCSELLRRDQIRQGFSRKSSNLSRSPGRVVGETMPAVKKGEGRARPRLCDFALVPNVQPSNSLYLGPGSVGQPLQWAVSSARPGPLLGLTVCVCADGQY